MSFRLRNIIKFFLYAAAAVYPVLVFYFLVIRKIPLRQFSILVIAFALIVFIAGTSKKKVKINLQAAFLKKYS
jgi:hypothetical protein